MKVELDCNDLNSAGQTDGTCRKFIDRVVRHHQIMLSAPILSEYIAVAERPRLIPYSSILKSLIREIEQLAVIVEPENLKFGLRDSDDEVYLATAAVGDAVLITAICRTLRNRGTGRLMSGRRENFSIRQRDCLMSVAIVTLFFHFSQRQHQLTHLYCAVWKGAFLWQVRNLSNNCRSRW